MKSLIVSLCMLLTCLVAFADPYLDVSYIGYSGGAYKFTLVNHQTCPADFSVSTSGATITSISPSPHGNTIAEGTAPAGISTFLMYGAFASTASFIFLDGTICTWEGSNPTPTTVGPVFNDLPVLFTNVNARLINGTLNFQWTSTMESSNAYYTVEGSSDGYTWFPVGKVNSYWTNGTSATPHSYTFTYNDLMVIEAGAGLAIFIYLLIVGAFMYFIPKLMVKLEKYFMLLAVILTLIITSCHKTNSVASKETVRYSYFRLTQTDLNGMVSYYQTIFKVN